MSQQISITPEEVLSIANNIANLNNKLQETLEATRTNVQSLSNSWSGEAASATISAFNSFADKYFASYKEMLDRYVTYLRNNVAGGYSEGENINKKLADAIL